MESITALIEGFHVALEPTNLLYLLIGVLLGMLVGVLPGLGPATGIALLVPLTFGLDPTTALIMLAGTYYGAMYGGAVTSILINAPGDASAVMTTLDGHQMTRNGRAGAALAVAALSSFTGGTIGIIALTLLALPLANVATSFGPVEIFALMVFAMTAIASLAGRSPSKGAVSTILGLIIATVGLDLQTGVDRYTFGVPELQDGIHIIVVIIGLFAVGEVFHGLAQLHDGKREFPQNTGRIWCTRTDLRRIIAPVLRSGPIGFLVGVLPGAGGSIAAMLGYSIETKVTGRSRQLGTGQVEGVAAPEAANNASVSGAMIPMLSLGIPGSSATAVLLGALILYGLQPGPLLFENQPDLVWGLLSSMYLGNLMLLLLALPLVGLFVRVLSVPRQILLPLILVLSLVGVYSINASAVDVNLTIFFGVVGYVFRLLTIPLAPMILALVLGSMMEQAFRQAMTISGGDPTIFLTNPISIGLLIVTALLIGGSLMLGRFTTSHAKSREPQLDSSAERRKP